jgi:hypothetical protein
MTHNNRKTMEAAFSVRSVRRLCKESQLKLKDGGGQAYDRSRMAVSVQLQKKFLVMSLKGLDSKTN